MVKKTVTVEQDPLDNRWGVWLGNETQPYGKLIATCDSAAQAERIAEGTGRAKPEEDYADKLAEIFLALDEQGQNVHALIDTAKRRYLRTKWRKVG